MWGSHNSLEHDLSGLETFARENLSKDQRIAYEARGANWFVFGSRPVTAELALFSIRQAAVSK